MKFAKLKVGYILYNYNERSGVHSWNIIKKIDDDITTMFDVYFLVLSDHILFRNYIVSRRMWDAENKLTFNKQYIADDGNLKKLIRLVFEKKVEFKKDITRIDE